MNRTTHRAAGRRCGWALGGAWVWMGAFAAHADGFSVGRVDIGFAEPGWEVMALPDRSQAYGGDRSGALAVQSAVFYPRPTATSAGALVLVSTSSTGMGGGRAAHMRYSPDCQPDENIYREGNEGINLSFAQCLTVTPRYNAASVFKQLAPPLLEAGVELPLPRWSSAPVYTVWSRHAISTGSFVDVRVFVWERIGGEGAAVSERLPPRVPPEHVVWGRQLRDAVKSSVYSLSGRLVMPALPVPQPLVQPSPPPVDAARPPVG